MTQLELHDFDFGDERINNRFKKAFKHLYASQSSLISNWSESNSEKQSCYRLFSNKKFTTDKLLKSHSRSVSRAILDQKNKSNIILAISDTVTITLGLNPHTPNIGRISTKKNPTYGLLTHSVLVVNAETNAPLGIPYQNYHYHKDTQEETKESSRWIEGLCITHELVGSRVIHVADREADMYEFLDTANGLGAQFIVRSKNVREVQLVEKSYSDETILDRLDLESFSDEFFIERPDGEIRLRVRYAPVIIKKPAGYKQNFALSTSSESIALTAIQAIGEDSNGDIINWLILTNLTIIDHQSALDCVKLYSKRWHIESFHKVMKTGFDIEKCQLEDGVRIEKMIAMVSIASAKGYALLQLSRIKNPPPPENFFSTSEFKAIKILMKKEKVNLKKIVHFIASHGGFIGNKKYPNPGILTFWKGWYKIYSKIETLSQVLNGELKLPIGLKLRCDE